MKAKEGDTGKGRGREVSGAGALTVRPLRQGEAPRFNELIGERHYLGKAKSVGDFLMQVAERDGEWVGLLVWGPASLKLKDRDSWIGWNPALRAERLKLVAQNRRFLLLKGRGEEPNLASRTLAASVRALPAQWEERFGYEPVLAESFTDPELFEGTCYRACGWEPAGMSAGFSRHRADFYVPNGRPKKLWLRPLRPDARKILCGGPLPAECAAALTPATSGVMPLTRPQTRSLMEALRSVKDPRSSHTRYRIGPVLAVVSMALLAGRRDIASFHRFGWLLRQNQRALLGLPFKKGSRKIREVPGYRVYYDLLARLDPDAFAGTLSEWLRGQSGSLPGALAVDGKMIRDCAGVVTLAEHGTGAPAAMAVMSQKEGEGERCEMRAARRLIAQAGDLADRVVTGDALHAQRETAAAIVGADGDYLLQIKANQPSLLKAAEDAFKGDAPLLPGGSAGTAGSKAEASWSGPPSPAP